MTKNLIAFGSHFVALGCALEYTSIDAALSVADSPKKLLTIVSDAISDISKFEDTQNYVDGASSIALADYIDGAKNPLKPEIRENILVALGIKEKGRFIRQVLSLSKSNRAWHTSEVANDCSYFLNLCTGRGTVNINSGGRKSSRQPYDYHTLDSHDRIKREQLVTPALEKLFGSIPDENFISGSKLHPDTSIIKKLKLMTMDERIALLTELGLTA